MVTEIEGILYRVDFSDGYKFVGSPNEDAIFSYCASCVSLGLEVKGVYEIRGDGSISEVPVLTDDEFEAAVEFWREKHKELSAFDD